MADGRRSRTDDDERRPSARRRMDIDPTVHPMEFCAALDTFPISKALCQLGRHSNLQALGMAPVPSSRPNVIAFTLEALVMQWAPTVRMLRHLPPTDCRRYLTHVIIKHMWKSGGLARYHMHDDEMGRTIVDISGRLPVMPRLADAPRPDHFTRQPEPEPDADEDRGYSFVPEPRRPGATSSTRAEPFAAPARASSSTRAAPAAASSDPGVPLAASLNPGVPLNPSSGEADSGADGTLHHDAMEELSQMLGLG